MLKNVDPIGTPFAQRFAACRSGVERAKTLQKLKNYKLINNQFKTANSSHFLYTLLSFSCGL